MKGSWYDYGARFYDPALGRFNSLDPLSENYIFQSPYVYALNNPVRFTDFMGMGPDDEVKKSISEITNFSTDDETGITTVTEVTLNTTESTEIVENDDGTTTKTKTTTTEIIESVTEINNEGGIVSNSATSKTREEIVVTEHNEHGIELHGEGVEKHISGPTKIEGGFIGNKTEAIAVIAFASNEEKNGPWYSKREVQDICSGVTAPVIAPANPGLQNRSGWGGVPYRNGVYSREDSMRMQGRNYDGPKLDSLSRYHKGIYKRNK